MMLKIDTILRPVIVVLFVFLFSCSPSNNKSSQNQADSALSSPLVTVLTNLPDSCQPKVIFLKNSPQPLSVKIPSKKNSGSYTVQTSSDPQTIYLKPPAVYSFIDTLTGFPIAPEAQGNGFFKNYTTENGLAYDAIICSVMDDVGNLWFGTPGGGVSRYDGKSFTNFTTGNGLAKNEIYTMLKDKKGHLWFGTDGGGVSRYNGQSFTNFTEDQGLAGNKVKSIGEDKDGNLWFGTMGGGVSRYDGKTFTTFTTKNGLPSDIILSITKDKNGDLWFGTYGGVSHCVLSFTTGDSLSFTNYTTDDGLVNNVVLSITAGKNGNLWFGTGGGVSLYNPSATGKSAKLFTNFTTVQGLVNNAVVTSMQDKSGNLWFGTYGGGVSRCNPPTDSSLATFTNFTTAQGLANNVVRSITEDRTGNIWFGTGGGGVSCYGGKSFTNFTTEHGLNSNQISSILEDKKGNLWFGTYKEGVVFYDGKSFINYSTTQGLINQAVFSIAEDRKGNIWIGTFGKGVTCYDGKSFTNYTTTQGLANNTVCNIVEDKKGNLWFSTEGGGVSCFDGKSFTNYTTIQGLADNTVWGMLEDTKGNLWFGTHGGVSCYDGKSFTNYTTVHGFGDNVIWSIEEDRKGNIWLGTENGLSRFDPYSVKRSSTFINYTTEEGLSDNSVAQIVFDPQDNIIVGTNRGICLITGFVLDTSKSENGITAIPAQNTLKNEELKNYIPKVEIYNTSTGYPVKDLNTGKNAMYQDSKGIIWIGTGADKTGLVRFDYSALNKSTEPPPVFIQSVKINNEDISWYGLQYAFTSSQKHLELSYLNALPAQIINEEKIALGRNLSPSEKNLMRTKYRDITFDSIRHFYPVPENLVLPYEHNNITIDFVAIQTDKNFLVRYQYMLDGYDKNWSPITDKTSAKYGNINEGTYTFKLKACSPFGVWSAPVVYTFKVLPPWWRTWWMYFLYGIVCIAVIAGFIRWRVKSLRREKAILEQKVELRTMQLDERNKLVEAKHKEITDSINYAERIQRSLLASKELLDENLKEYFVFFQPKDVVSGDFYWAGKLYNNQFVLATADSTGHGVPGAIMSILNISCLEKAIEVQKCVEPSEILGYTRIKIIETLKKDGSVEGGKDGMDCSLLCLDLQHKKLTFAMANNPVWIVRNKQLIAFSPDKMPVGKHDKDKTPFTLHTFDLHKGDVIYTLTDGMSDQFGGPSGKKFMSKQLKEVLVSISDLPMEEQKEALKKVFIDWKGNLEQIDDICIIGLKIHNG
jgi:ligand-binding sensor domain-containing protein/serine phosphatase RsbU (regulator of sigma subunit)